MNGGSADYDESDFVAYYIKAFENAKDKAAYVDKTETIELPCRKEDGQWKITEFAELSNIYYCNIINTYDKYFDGEGGEPDFIAETAGDEEAIENGETVGSEETAGLDEAAAASQETGADETQESMPADDDIRLFEEDGLKTTSLEFAVWDDTGEMYITMLYIGTNSKGQYVGNCTITVSDGDETESVEGVFVENDDETGTITIDNGNTADYSLIWDTDHYVMTIDMGGTFYNLLEAEWAYGNVG